MLFLITLLDIQNVFGVNIDLQLVSFVPNRNGLET